ncbi:MAG TPA: DNA-directed RNA polymerase subunit beta, partial [Geodermatophilus sp.]|nr:DNA-directed RNA polymerase subunit beta [Geodermatophilus sp.]
MAGSRPTSISPSTTESGGYGQQNQTPQAGPRTGEADQQKIPGAPLRVSFAKISEPLEVPDLLALQTASFDWLVGSPEWRATLSPEEQAAAVGGLAEILEEISPIEDFSGSMSLSFSNPRFEDVKASLEECKDKDMTYAAPLFVTAEFMNNTTGEIKSQTVFMGDFPIMTNKGTFVINGTERVVVSQLVRSPGVYFDKTLDKTSDKDVFSAKVIPSRGAWLEFDVDKRDTVGVRIDRKRRQPVTVLLKALGWTEDRIREHFQWSPTILATLEKDHIAGQDEALLDIYRKLRPGEPPTRESAQALLENLFFNPRRYDLAKVGRYKLNKRLKQDKDVRTLTNDDIIAILKTMIRLNNEQGRPDDIDHLGNRRIRSVGELIANQFSVGLSRMARLVKERMSINTDPEKISLDDLVNAR